MTTKDISKIRTRDLFEIMTPLVRRLHNLIFLARNATKGPLADGYAAQIPPIEKQLAEIQAEFSRRDRAVGIPQLDFAHRERVAQRDVGLHNERNTCTMDTSKFSLHKNSGPCTKSPSQFGVIVQSYHSSSADRMRKGRT